MGFLTDEDREALDESWQAGFDHGLHEAVEQIVARHRIAAVRGEADWLKSAVENGRTTYPLTYSAEFRSGFECAANWVRFHADHPHLLERA